MTESDQTQLEEVFRNHLHDAFNRGIRVGIKTASSIVEGKLKDTSIPIALRVKDVRRFCQVSTENPSFISQDEQKDGDANEVSIEHNSAELEGVAKTMPDHDVWTASEREVVVDEQVGDSE